MELEQEIIQEVTLIFNNEKANWGVDFISPVNANQINSFNSDKIVFAGYGIDDDLYSDYTHLDVKGKVEKVGLRIVTVRSDDGTLWYLRNGEILKIGNQSQSG